MNQNIKVAKQLVKLAKNLIALDEEGDSGSFQVLHDYENMQESRLDAAQKQGKKYILHHKDKGNLWRIQACKNFGMLHIKKGDFGGFITSEKNLSHDGDCWVYHDAKVYGNAQVSGDAQIFDKAQVSGDAKVKGNANIYGNAQVYGNACVYGDAIVRGNAQIYDDAQVYDQAQVWNNAVIYGEAKVCGIAWIMNNAKVNYDVKNKKITK